MNDHEVSNAQSVNTYVPGGWIKKILPRTLLGRSLLILITPVLLIQVIATFIFFDRHWSKVTSRLAYAVAGEISVVVHIIEEDGNINPRIFEDIVLDMRRHLDLDVSLQSGEAFLSSNNTATLNGWESMVVEKLSFELKGQLSKPFSIGFDSNAKRIDVSVQLNQGLLRVSFPQRRLFSSSGYIFLLWVICTSLVLLLIAIVFMRNQIRPIRKLAAAAERFGKGRDAPFFKPEGAFEVRQAANAFLDMRRRIQRQVSQRTQMLAGVSHDLRTPLTRLKLQLALLEGGADVEAMKSDIQEMEKMIEGYLDFLRGQEDEQATLTDIGALFEKTLEQMKGDTLRISSHIEPEIKAVIRPMAFERAIVNLLSNARKYADHVWVAASKTEEMLKIDIEDNGPGLSEELYEDVFRPFYRVDSSRNAETGGTGLGLAIVKDIVHSHGGKIWLEKSVHGGLKVLVRVPV